MGAVPLCDVTRPEPATMASALPRSSSSSTSSSSFSQKCLMSAATSSSALCLAGPNGYGVCGRDRYARDCRSVCYACEIKIAIFSTWIQMCSSFSLFAFVSAGPNGYGECGRDRNAHHRCRRMVSKSLPDRRPQEKGRPDGFKIAVKSANIGCIG